MTGKNNWLVHEGLLLMGSTQVVCLLSTTKSR